MPITIMRGLTGESVAHGHPALSANYGATFSMPDIRGFALSSWKEFRAVASGRGEWNYVVRRTAKAQGRALNRHLGKDAPALARQYRRAQQAEEEEELKAEEAAKKKK